MEGKLYRRRVLTLGADPEIFVFNGLKLVPAFEFLPPKITRTHEGVEINNLMYWDGFQAEWKYNHDGNHCQNNLVMHTRENLRVLLQKAQVKYPNARLSLQNVVRIPNKTLVDAHPQHVELGCMPSFNAYKLKGLEVLDPRSLKYRFAGGHMHFGTWAGKVKPNYERIVRTLDNILGVWGVGVARAFDNPIRRQYYGLAGEFRTPTYSSGLGVEYRVLSNFWLNHPAIMQLTWDIGRNCVHLATSRFKDLWAGDEAETIETINKCDVKQANRIIKRNEPMFRWLLSNSYISKKCIDKALQATYEGMDSVVPVADLTENWYFDKQWIPNAGRPDSRWESYAC